MPRGYFGATFGGVPMLIASLGTERGRDVAVQSPNIGDKHKLSKRGLKVHKTQCEILFVDQPGQAPYLDRAAEFIELAESDDPQIFTHPLDGTFVAVAEGLDVTADAGELCVRVSCTIYRDDPPQQVFPAAAGSSTMAGIEAVSTAAGLTSAALAELLADLEDSPAAADALATPAAASAQVTAWGEADELDSQEVFLGVATLTQKIDDAIEELALKTDLSRWEAYKQMILLRYTVVRAGQALTSDSRDMFDLYVETPRPVVAICAEVYGAALAVSFADRVTKINRLRIPGLVAAGTTLKMPRAA